MCGYVLARPRKRVVDNINTEKVCFMAQEKNGQPLSDESNRRWLLSICRENSALPDAISWENGMDLLIQEHKGDIGFAIAASTLCKLRPNTYFATTAARKMLSCFDKSFFWINPHAACSGLMSAYLRASVWNRVSDDVLCTLRQHADTCFKKRPRGTIKALAAPFAAFGRLDRKIEHGAKFFDAFVLKHVPENPNVFAELFIPFLHVQDVPQNALQSLVERAKEKSEVFRNCRALNEGYKKEFLNRAAASVQYKRWRSAKIPLPA